MSSPRPAPPARTNVLPAPMCSGLTRAAGEDPIGSASSFDQLLVLEVPLPWPRAVRAARRFPPAVAAALSAADAANVRYNVLFVVPNAEYSPAGMTRVLHLTRPPGPLRAYTKTDYLVPLADQGALAAALLTEPAALPAFAAAATDTGEIRDFLVCTHGTRDRCCGTLGFPLYNHLRRGIAETPSLAARAWRVAHIGGHRFAPTMVSLPDGRTWSHLTEPTNIDRVLHQAPAPPDLLRHYRGWAGLRSLPEMVAERALFTDFGWDWLRYTIESEVLVPTDPAGATTVRLTYRGPVGAGYADITVAPTGEVVRNPGSCGDPKLGDHPLFHITARSNHRLP